jgi:hypothetical protein
VFAGSTRELVAALQPANRGRRIELAAREYLVDRPLIVPDGTTLAGAGVMQFDADGLPAAFEAGTATTLRVAAAFEGPVLSLGNGSRLERLRVLDREAAGPPERRGNVVSVASRAPRDAIAAGIVDCELVNPTPVGFSEDGPVGHGIVLLTLNPRFELAPAAHEGARLGLLVERSIVSSRTGAAVLATNFAAAGHVEARLVGNRFDGPLVAGGGTSRPDLVRDAVTRVESLGNLYRRSGMERHGWLLLGASSSPHFQELPGQGASGNLLRIESRDDRIEGFVGGLMAAAARRLGAGSPTLHRNRLELDLERLRIRTEGASAADLELRAAWSEVVQGEGPGEFPAGDHNVLRVSIRDSIGSGQRRNVYAAVDGPEETGNRGTGNRLEIVGRTDDFETSNRGFDPSPGAEHFTGDLPLAPD